MGWGLSRIGGTVRIDVNDWLLPFSRHRIEQRHEAARGSTHE
jgi:hypothetical protein